jgi:caa(3)-type oxidase subunit IV
MAIARVTSTHHLLTFLALVVMATASLMIGVFVKVPFLGPAASLVIAVGKAVLVLWFFMHLAEQGFRTRLAIVLSLLLVVLLISLTAADVGTRRLEARQPRPGPQEAFYIR